jgi:phosphatidylglycerol:prolipoprotein diacylglycerol transferase
MQGLPMAFWIHDLDPILFEVGPLAIRWYGLAYLAGLFSAIFLLNAYRKRGWLSLASAQIEELAFGIFLGLLIGGRLGYMILYDLGNWIREPLLVFKVWEGGMSFHGGLIGGLVGCYWVVRAKKIPFQMREIDLFATVVPPALFFGRLANFVNGELWGKVTDVSWAVIFPRSEWLPLEPSLFVASLGIYLNPRHPSQLYEALTEGLFLFVYLQIRLRFIGDTKRYPGRLTGEFFIGYALMRIVCEIFREPDASLLLGISRGTFYSLIMLMSGVCVWIFVTVKQRFAIRDRL